MGPCTTGPPRPLPARVAAALGPPAWHCIRRASHRARKEGRPTPSPTRLRSAYRPATSAATADLPAAATAARAACGRRLSCRCPLLLGFCEYTHEKIQQQIRTHRVPCFGLPNQNFRDQTPVSSMFHHCFINTSSIYIILMIVPWNHTSAAPPPI